MWYHLEACARRAPVPLTEPTLAAAAWKGLRRAFPDVAAAVLMPTGLRLLAWGRSATLQRIKLARFLSGLSRVTRLGIQLPEWEKAAVPSPIVGAEKLERQVRCVVLDPCREGLTDDPLRWVWTTHRDVMGGVADPWVTAPALAMVLARSQEGFTAAHHAFVSGDPSVCVESTPAPRPFCLGNNRYVVSTEGLIAAAAAATRSAPEAILRRTATRRLFLQLAWEVGLRDTSLLARQCGVTTNTIRKHRTKRDDQAIAAALVCLGDDRFIPPQGPFWAAHHSARSARPDSSQRDVPSKGLPANLAPEAYPGP